MFGVLFRCILIHLVFVLAVFGGSAADAEKTPAGNEQPADAEASIFDDFDFQWGGHAKVRGSTAWPEEDSQYHPVGLHPMYDGTSEVRLKGRLFYSDYATLDVHYENVFSGGDTLSRGQKLRERYPHIFPEGLSKTIDDDRRFMDLTDPLLKEDEFTWYHRLDRLALTLDHSPAVVTLGRQAVTWGNGLIFNPMDLFNPFSPTDIERDYKVGDDMISIQYMHEDFGGQHLLFVPRRDVHENRVEWESSSLAYKHHFFYGEAEYDILVAKHYKDMVVGLGRTGYIGNAAWRADLTWTALNQPVRGKSGFFSLSANVDYSWVWWEKNMYGFVEFYYNGLSNNEYSKLIQESAVADRLDRGEMYTLGRTYAAVGWDVELHPLVMAHLTVINNLHDASGTAQPRIVWNVTQNTELTAGADLYYGGTNSEFGGYSIPGSNLRFIPSDSVYLRFTWFF